MAESLLKEIGIALGVVGGLLLALTLYTGVWPPLVVVESGSMMHPQQDDFGNLGTIDPGDLVLVKDVSSRDEVSLFVDGGESHYGRAGDVIVYYPRNDRRRTPIIHRAMTWVDATEGGCTVQWFEGTTRSCDADGEITIERWGIRDWAPRHDGFITLGDNNEQADQATGRVGGAVQMNWVQGKARGEIPWIGLIKLAVSPGPNQAAVPADWVKVGNAYAPADLWIMLGVSLAGLFLAPMGIEAGYHEARRRLGDDGRGPEPDLEADPGPSNPGGPSGLGGNPGPEEDPGGGPAEEGSGDDAGGGGEPEPDDDASEPAP